MELTSPREGVHSQMDKPVGTLLRLRRVRDLELSLRQMARDLRIAPAHLSDIELGERTPSEDLLVRIADAYKVPAEMVRAGWRRPDPLVCEVASTSPLSMRVTTELFELAADFEAEQWEKLIQSVRRIAKGSGRRNK